MNWKILSLTALSLVTPFALFAACEPCPEEGCNIDDGLGGADTGGGGGNSETGGAPASGGTASGGSATGGAVGGEGGLATGGDAGGTSEGGTGATTAQLDCQDDGSVEGTPGSCEPLSDLGDPNYDCELCVQQFCCDEFAACNAEEPVTACRFGSTLYDGEPVEGEFDCMLLCLRTEGSLGDAYDVQLCAEQCGATECNPDAAGPAATELVSCMLGLTQEDLVACSEDCQMLP